jgi:hypothetical protein
MMGPLIGWQLDSLENQQKNMCNLSSGKLYIVEVKTVSMFNKVLQAEN